MLVVDHIVTLLDKGSVVCAAFIDLRKAFDSLDHCLLLQRISELGVYCEYWNDLRTIAMSNQYHRVKGTGIFLT